MDRRGAKTMASMLWQQAFRQFNALEAAGITVCNSLSLTTRMSLTPMQRRLSSLMKGSSTPWMAIPSGSMQQDMGTQTEEAESVSRFVDGSSTADAGRLNGRFSLPIYEYGTEDDSLERAIQHLSPKDVSGIIIF